MSKILKKSFHVLKTIFILYSFFWTFAPIGIMIFGIGPTLLMLIALFNHYGWDINFKGDTWKMAWKEFKVNFKRGNIYFLSYGVILSLIIYLIFIVKQTATIWSPVIVVLLVLAIILATTTFFFTLVLEMEYEMKMLDILKSSFSLYFIDFSSTVKMLVGVGILTWLSYFNLYTIFFGTIEATLVIVSVFTKKLLAKLWVNKQLRNLLPNKEIIKKYPNFKK